MTTLDGFSNELRAALVPPPEGVEAKVSVVEITPDEAYHILHMMGYSRQRKIAQGPAAKIADAMSHDEFIGYREITFAPDDDGNILLIDGQHRLQAVVTSHWTGKWVVCCLWGHFKAETAYIRLDTAQKERTAAVIGRAMDLFQHMSTQMQNAIISAARYPCIWDPRYELPVLAHIPPERDGVERIVSQMTAFEKADEIIQNTDVRAHIRRRLGSPLVLAIMAETLHTCPEEAEAFWRSVAISAGGIASDLHSLLLEGKPPKSSSNYMARLATQAWNQRASTGRLRRQNRHMIRVSQTELTVPT